MITSDKSISYSYKARNLIGLLAFLFGTVNFDFYCVLNSFVYVLIMVYCIGVK